MPFEQNYANENNATSIHAVNHSMLPIHLQGAKIEESWEMQW